VEQFIRKGDRVLLKVNAAFASAPALVPPFIRSWSRRSFRLCVQAGAASVTVTDNPINDPPSCFRLTGIAEAVQKAGARLVLPQESFSSRRPFPGAR